MPDDTAARVMQPPPAAPSEEDYATFSAALSESARGRAFLAEYARRNRNADTEMLLAALARLEARIGADASAESRLRDELRMLLIAIRVARPDIDATLGPAKAVKLAALLDQLERRIEAMVEAKPVAPAAPAFAVPAAAEASAPDAGRPPLSVVPLSDEPELPIPSPAAQTPAMTLVDMTRVETLVERSTAVPDVAWFEAEPAAANRAAASPEPPAAVTPSAIAAAVEAAIAAAKVQAAKADAVPEVKIIKAGTMPPPAPFAGEDFSARAPEPAHAAPRSTDAAQPPDPLAAVAMLSDEERIALFT